MSIKNIIQTLIYISIIGVILELFMPESKLKKYTTVLMSLLAILTILSPLVQILEDTNVANVISNTLETISVNTTTPSSNIYDLSKFTDKVILKSTKEKVEEELKNNINTEFVETFEAEQIDISLSSSYMVEEIKLVLRLKNEGKKDQKVELINEIINNISKTYNIDEKYIVIVVNGE